MGWWDRILGVRVGWGVMITHHCLGVKHVQRYVEGSSTVLWRECKVSHTFRILYIWFMYMADMYTYIYIFTYTYTYTILHVYIYIYSYLEPIALAAVPSSVQTDLLVDAVSCWHVDALCWHNLFCTGTKFILHWLDCLEKKSHSRFLCFVEWK